MPTFYHTVFNCILHITEDRQIIVPVITLGQHAHSLGPLFGLGPALMLREMAGIILLWLMIMLVNTYHLCFHKFSHIFITEIILLPVVHLFIKSILYIK